MLYIFTVIIRILNVLYANISKSRGKTALQHAIDLCVPRDWEKHREGVVESGS